MLDQVNNLLGLVLIGNAIRVDFLQKVQIRIDTGVVQNLVRGERVMFGFLDHVIDAVFDAWHVCNLPCVSIKQSDTVLLMKRLQCTTGIVSLSSNRFLLVKQAGA